MHIEIDNLIINGEVFEVGEMEDTISLTSKKHEIIMQLIEDSFVNSFYIKFQRSYHPNCMIFEYKDTETQESYTEKIFFKAESDFFELKINKKIKELKISVDKTYDIYNRLVIYEYYFK